MKYSIFFSAVLLLLFTNSCKEKPTETKPVIDDEANLQPGRRDYVWRYDTLDTGGEQIGFFWGKSPNSIWARVSFTRVLWHFNGTNWHRFNISNYLVTPYCIFGTSENNVWFLGDSFFALHYNGHSFQRFVLPKPPEFDGIIISGIWGDAPNNIFAVGTFKNTAQVISRAVIFKFDGVEWKIAHTINSQTQSQLSFIGKDIFSSKILVYGYLFDTTNIIPKIYEYKNGSLIEIHSGTECWMYPLLNGRVFFSKGSRNANHMLKISNNNLVIWKDMTNDSVLFVGMLGRHEKDYFTLGLDYSSTFARTRLFHCNGLDYKPVYEGLNVSYKGLLTLPRDFIFPVHLPNGKVLIVRGTLPDSTSKK